MIDYSFIRLKPTLSEAMNVGNSPMSSIIYYDAIRLSPDEGYRQITNVYGGIALQNIFTAELVDCSGDFLEDVSNHIYSSEVVDSKGDSQLIIEIVNLPTDWYNRPVLFKFYDGFVTYYSNPFNVTDEFKELTTYFEYSNSKDFLGIAYTPANVSQSIRLSCFFSVSSNESEISDYYQISRQATISARVNYKSFENYRFDYIDSFVYDRLNVLLQHEMVYIDTVRQTNKVSFESSEPIDQLNVFEAKFKTTKNYSDIHIFGFEIFDGLLLVEKIPLGYYTLSSLPSDLKAKFNLPIQINTGTLRVYDATDNSLVVQYNETDMLLSDPDQFIIQDIGLDITENGSYYIEIDQGLVSALGIDFEGINEPDVWTFTITDADYDSEDYDDNDYFTD